MKFTIFNFGKELQEGLEMMGFVEQLQSNNSIPIIQKNIDLIAVQTGTGKTKSFVLPILDKLTKKNLTIK